MQNLLRGATLAVFGLVPILLAGCGDKEADQRKAFITFLQTAIIDRPGIHVPQLTDEERTSFGPYASQYEIIANFNKAMDGSVSPKFKAAMARGAIQSAGDLVGRRADIEAAKTTLDQMAGTLGADIAQANEAHLELTQPDDVKAVFDKAYERLVTAPAATFKEIVPVTNKVFSDALDLSDYIEHHKDRLKLLGSTLQVSDANTQKELAAKLQNLQTDQKAIQAAQTKFQALLSGTSHQ
jgi:hypothetical protein